MVLATDKHKRIEDGGKNRRFTSSPHSSASSVVDSVVSSCRGGENTFLFVDCWSLFIEHRADAYGNTLIFTGPGTDGVWFTDGDVQSSYGANEIIYCGYRFDPESELYYVRNRGYSPTLGRWLQRDPIGYRQSANLYVGFGDAPISFVDPTGTLCTSYSYDGRLTPPLGLPAAFGFSVNFNGEIRYRIQIKKCPHCCLDGSKGETYAISARISGDITGTAYLGLYFHPSWADVFIGLSGSLDLELSGSASDSWDTCRGAPGKLHFCVSETISAELRGGAEASIHWGWFKVHVGIEGWLSGRFTDRVCFACDTGGCEVANVTLGAWSAEIGAKTCFWGGCISWTQEFS